MPDKLTADAADLEVLEGDGTPLTVARVDGIAHDQDGRLIDPVTGEPIVPTAASVRRPDPERLPAGIDYPDELEGPPEFPGCKPGVDPEGDERRRLERLSAKSAQSRELPLGARRAMTRACYDAIVRQRMIPHSSHILTEALAERAGVDVETASAWLTEEAARRRGDS